MGIPNKIISLIKSRCEPHLSFSRRVRKTIDKGLFGDKEIGEAIKLALYLFMVQAYKTHDSIETLVVRGLEEDAATLTRRLLELAIQVQFLDQPNNRVVRNERAGTYLAELWEDLPRDQKLLLPDHIRTPWNRYHTTYRHNLFSKKENWQHWWGSRQMKDLFSKVGKDEVYNEDYSLLSAIAHGRPPNFVAAGGVYDFYDSQYGPTLFAFANGYFVDITYRWNQEIATISKATLVRFSHEAEKLRNLLVTQNN